MNFLPFKKAIQKRFKTMTERGPIFQAAVDKDQLWELYLSSFPEGTNPIYRERTEHDCSCCRSFVKNAGTMVQIVDGKLESIWDLDAGEYQGVANVLSAYLKASSIENIFLHYEGSIGTDKNRELDGTTNSVKEWEHFFVTLPTPLYANAKNIPTIKGECLEAFEMCSRALGDYTLDALETVRDLISQNSLYRGAEKKNLVNTFFNMKLQFDKIETEQSKSFFVWNQVLGPNKWACRIRGDVIGTLIGDISEGKDLEAAVKSFEDKVSGTNYKRPTALITPKMKEKAKEALQELGLMSALDRRFANLDDISISNLLFANRDTRKKLVGDVFDDLPTKKSTYKFDHVEEVPIETFIKEILPTAKALDLFVDTKHRNNFVSLITADDASAKLLFKWNNPFSWSYVGDVTDSIKEKVKAAGGSVTGDVCCRLAWFNSDDLDLHMDEPRFKIYFGNKVSEKTGGNLDVDMNAHTISSSPVENIVYPSARRMLDGVYTLSVNQFRSRQTIKYGFEVELDVQGKVYHFAYDQPMRTGATVKVAQLKVTNGNIEVTSLLSSTVSSVEMWGLKTMEFVPISAMMLSPNFWQEEGVGNKHYFFMLEGCKNDGSARAIYNEFLTSKLETHRKTMELVGAKLLTEKTDYQLSGLGFSSTQRNDCIIRVYGSFQRDIKVIF